MTRKEIDDIFQEYGQYATGKDYALVHAVVAAVSLRCVCGEPNSAGTHRTDGPCLAPQPEQERCENCGEFGVCCQPEQEPVAWGMPSAGEGHIVDVITPEEHDRVEGGYTVPLYATPPQRTWVGLDDIDLAGCSNQDEISSARYWEAKLKEKNT